MNRQKLLAAIIFLAITGATTGLIIHVSGNQQLGPPGVATRPLPDSHNLLVIMPDQVPGYSSEVTTQAEGVVLALPDDTSFGRCKYTAKDGFWSIGNVVLMGTDRSSIHKPQVCLTSQGWSIDDAASRVENVPMQKPFPYDLPVMHLTATQKIDTSSGPKVISSVYVYWYVDGEKITAQNAQIMWWMARDVLLTGVLDRFAYISYFSVCEPGQEAATFERMKKIIMDTVPQYQLVPGAGPRQY